MHFSIHHYHHLSPELENLIMAVSQQITDLIAQVKANTDLEQSADLALRTLSVQITDLGNQVSALQAQIAAGSSLSTADIAALAQSVTDLKTSATTLQADVPANTTPTPAPAPLPPVV
jgi:chromosome segregation ATPase